MQLLQRVYPMPISPQRRDELVANAKQFGCTEAEILDEIKSAENAEMWHNSQYVVTVDRERHLPYIHLSIRRVDRGPARDWRDFQAIKNQLVGVRHEGVELYPVESRVVDTANQFHLWVMSIPDQQLNVGFNQGLKTSESSGGAVQRPLNDNPYSALALWLSCSPNENMPQKIFELQTQALENGYAVRGSDHRVTMSPRYYSEFGAPPPVQSPASKSLAVVQAKLQEHLTLRPEEYRYMSKYDWEELSGDDVDAGDDLTWCIIRRHETATNGKDVLSAVVSTHIAAEAICLLLNKGMTADALVTLLDKDLT